jgi:regulation of enolase protein 1 (concanavalin A-like superfamily)
MTKSIKMKPLLFLGLFLCACLTGFSQPSTTGFSMNEIPKRLNWVNHPVKWTYQDKILTIIAPEKTDLFVDPQHEYAVVNSPKAVFVPADSFLLSGKVMVNFKTDYDAGVLVVYAGASEWAKLCFEFSPQKKPFVVSVVNNGISDDCNHVPIVGNTVYLRIAGLGKNIFAFHYSTDGKYWNLVRYFSLSAKNEARVGFSSQSPTGLSCTSTFSEIYYNTTRLMDIRNGK